VLNIFTVFLLKNLSHAAYKLGDKLARTIVDKSLLKRFLNVANLFYNNDTKR
jgi:hypothetical protein